MAEKPLKKDNLRETDRRGKRRVHPVRKTNQGLIQLCKKVTLSELVGIIALVISIIALIVSFQANRVARESNRIAGEANLILLESNSSDPRLIEADILCCEILTITGCHSSDFEYYYLHFTIGDSFTFSNVGGRSVSMYEVNLKILEDWYTTTAGVVDVSGFVDLPVDIEPGVAEKFYFGGTNKRYFDSKGEHDELLYTILGIPYPKAQWYFKFSDGSSIVHEVSLASVSVQPTLANAVCGK